MEIPIPGYSSSSGIDTQKVIKDLVEAERKPIRTFEKRIEDSQQQTRLWNNLEKDMRQFQTYAKRLYGFENPFDERSATSSDEAVLTVKASRGAQTGEYELQIKQTAASDVWASDPITKNLSIPKGSYTFAVGEHKVTVDFDGGNVDDFVQEFGAAVDTKIMTLRMVQRGVDKNYITLILESKKLGKKFALSLLDSAEKLSHDIGFQTYGKENSTTPLSIGSETITRIISDATHVEKSGGTFSALESGGIVQFTLSNALLQDAGSSKDASLKLEFALERSVDKKKKTDSDIVNIDSAIKATLQDATVLGTQNFHNETVQEKREELGIVFSADAKETLYTSKKHDEKNKVLRIDVPLASIRDAQGHASFIVANPFPKKKLILHKASVYALGGEESVVVKNPISRARNAVIQLNGVDMEREINVVDDILPGLTLKAKRKSDNMVIVSVQNDEELIKDSIINFVGSYNQMMKKITLYTSNDIVDKDRDIVQQNSVLNLMEFESDQAREQAEKDLGKLSGNFSLVRLTNSLITAVSRQYPNKKNSQITLLRHIGIASHLSDPSRARTRLGTRFLDIDETKLDEALTKNVDDVAELFGSDQNNDLAVEEGVAFATVDLVRPFIITGGITDQKRKGLQRDIADNRTQISRYEKRVEDFRRKTTRDFASMERSLSKLEDASSALKGLPGASSD